MPGSPSSRRCATAKALRERAEIQAAGCVGASGAVAACVTGACVLDPGRRVYLFFLVPIPAIGFAGWRLDRASDPETQQQEQQQEQQQQRQQQQQEEEEEEDEEDEEEEE